MADTKTSALTALTGIAPDDLIPVVDVSDTTQGAGGSLKKITREEFQTYNAGTFTTDKKVIDLSVTWNNAAVTFTADKINVTDTASGANSLLLDRQVGGVSKFSVKKDGAIASYRGAGAYTAEIPFYFSNDNGSATKTFSLYYSGGTGVYFNVGGTRCSHLSPDGFNTTGYYGLNASAGSGVDTILARDAAGALAQRNGTNAQIFRLYHTYTDASNYERGFMQWNSNVLEIGAEAAGTGTARAVSINGSTLSLKTAGATRATIYTGSIAMAANVALNVGTGGYIGMAEFNGANDPAAPGANGGVVYLRDDGAGKTQLCVRFNTGAVQVLATEP